ncbi:hypothetical protein O1611_g1096 [Lasiodiplodia mahajangana]|uniref:Uncharacterized protein n=1 Tax=Lasiodiplodia mahajangana TaxID=1108764 RepID=A0ACC2JYE3_9PEZI|nr:hypothetical protein O1611_g1096 [Lasiodiplodia mahajangana]
MLHTKRGLNTKPCSEYTVAVVCAHEFEMSAVRAMFSDEYDSPQPEQGDPNHYIVGCFAGHDIVIAWRPGLQSESAAAMVAMDLYRTFPSIESCFLTGIGGGVPGTCDIRLGDVVVGHSEGIPPLVQYSLGTGPNGRFQRRNSRRPQYETFKAAFITRSDMIRTPWPNRSFIAEMHQRGSHFNFQRPPSASDVLFAADYPHAPNDGHACENCDAELVVERSARENDDPKVHYGLIASGVGITRRDFEEVPEAQQLGRDVLCVDVEAAGLSPPIQCIVVRGISDYADSHKNNDWQYYAAAAAAACTKEILLNMDSGRYQKPLKATSGFRRITSSPYGTDDVHLFVGNGIQNLGGSMTCGGSFNVTLGR